MKLLKVLLYVLICVIAMIGCSPNTEKNEQETEEEYGMTSTPVVEQEIKNVKVVQVESTEFTRALLVPGRISPFQQVSVTAMTGGEITELMFKTGDFVEKNEQVAELDHTMIKLQIDKAKITKESAELVYESVKNSHEKTCELYQCGSIAEANFDSSENQLKNAEIAVRLAQSDLRMISERYKQAFVYAPISGVVTKKAFNEGQVIPLGSEVYELVDVSNVLAVVEVNENSISQIEVGQEVKVVLSSNKTVDVLGTVHKIDPLQRTGTKSYPVEILVSNEADVFKIGMTVEASVKLTEAEVSPAIPKKASFFEDGNNYVYVEKEGVVRKRQIEIGEANKEQFQILSGLSEGEKIVVSGKEYLDDSDTVQVVSN